MKLHLSDPFNDKIKSQREIMEKGGYQLPINIDEIGKEYKERSTLTRGSS